MDSHEVLMHGLNLIVCDGCRAVIEKKDHRRIGWYSNLFGDLCPECTEKARKSRRYKFSKSVLPGKTETTPPEQPENANMEKPEIPPPTQKRVLFTVLGGVEKTRENTVMHDFLSAFADYLIREGYMDSDWWAEGDKEARIEAFLKERHG